MRNVTKPCCSLAETRACTTLRLALSLLNAEVGAIVVIIPMSPLSSQSFACHVRHDIARGSLA